MKRKRLYIIITIISITVVIAGVVWGICSWHREKDMRWQAAKEVYKLQTALKELDNDWELESLSEVYPYEIKSQDGTCIYYYCCITAYLDESPDEIAELNKAAISQVVDVGKLNNPVVRHINGSYGVQGELGDDTYLCWTISPTYSCVLKYNKGSVSEDMIIRIAESVIVPSE